MSSKKLSLADLQQQLSRDEMKQIVGGEATAIDQSFEKDCLKVACVSIVDCGECGSICNGGHCYKS